MAVPWIAFVVHANMFGKYLLQKLLQSECVEGDTAMTHLSKDLVLHLEVELTQLCNTLLCYNVIIQALVGVTIYWTMVFKN